MTNADIAPNVISLTAVISACDKGGAWQEDPEEMLPVVTALEYPRFRHFFKEWNRDPDG